MPKIDGVRAVNVGGRLVSRTLKEIPNRYTQELFGRPEFHGLDGELVVGLPTDKNLMQQTTSGVMTQAGEPTVTWCIFDKWDMVSGYRDRLLSAVDAIRRVGDERVNLLTCFVVRSVADILRHEAWALEHGYEGLILRAIHAPYKQNRSTLREGYMLKIKRFVDGEAEVLDVLELMHNENEAVNDERGYTKRSSHAENQRAGGTLGALRVRDIQTGVDFDIGSGYTAEQRANLWEGRKYLKGKLVKYKHFPVGVKDKPRHPVFLGFRDRRDV